MLRSRTTRIANGAVCVLVVALVAYAGVHMWRIMSGGPVSLGFLGPRLEAMINAGLEDIQLQFGDSVIEWSKDRALAHLKFTGVRITDAEGHVIGRVPEANLSLSGPALLNGEVAPTQVELVGASAQVVRRADGRFQLGLKSGGAKNTEEKGEGAVTQAVLEAMLKPEADDKLSRYLTRFAISKAEITLFDEQTQSYWRAADAALSFERKDEGVTLSLSAPVRLADKSVWMLTGSARYAQGSENIAIEAAFKPVRLSALAASGKGLKMLQGLDLAVQGNTTCDLAMSGALGRCKFWLNAGSGSMRLPALKRDPIEIKSAALTVTMDFPQGRYAIEEMAWAGRTIKGRVSGEGAFAFDAEGGVSRLTADWSAEDISIDAPNVFDGGLALQSARFRGEFDGARGHLSIAEASARNAEFEIGLSGALQDHPVSTGIALKGGFKNLAIAQLNRLWPAGAAEGARTWIAANVHAGVLREGSVEVNIPAGADVATLIPDEMLNIAFSIEKLQATYLNGLPDLIGASGTAVARGNTFEAKITSGSINGVRLTEGSVAIPHLHLHGTTGTIAGKMEGPTQAILAVLDRPRLGYPARYGIDSASAGGTARVNFSFGVPMLKDLNADDVAIGVDAEMKDVKLAFSERLRLTGGSFLIKLDGKGMKANGAVQLNGAPVGFNWLEDFTGTAPAGTRIDVTSTLTDAHRASLGFGTQGYIEGKTTLVASLSGSGGKFQKARVNANLGAARLSVPELGWAKPEDATASLKGDLVFRDAGTVEVNAIEASGPGLKAIGRMTLDGNGLREAEFKRVQLGPRNDFALLYRDDGQTRTIEASGRAIDAGGLLGGDDDERQKGAKPAAPARQRGLSLKGKFELAYLKGEVWFTGVNFLYAEQEGRLAAFKIDASADAANLRGELVTSPDGSRRLRLQTADAGRLLRGLTGFRSLIGGELSLGVDLAPLGQKPSEAAFDGNLRIDKFKLVNQPFVARLLSAGSFTGIDDLLRNEGVTFTRLEQEFHGRGDQLTLTNGRAAGPAIGLTAQGVVNRATDRIELNGTIVPIYGLNSMFQDVPLIGDILGSRDGEGIFGVTYGVNGEIDELKISVNPVSVLAPGFLRKLFQMGPTPQTATPVAPPPARPDQTRKPAAN